MTRGVIQCGCSACVCETRSCHCSTNCPRRGNEANSRRESTNAVSRFIRLTTLFIYDFEKTLLSHSKFKREEYSHVCLPEDSFKRFFGFKSSYSSDYVRRTIVREMLARRSWELRRGSPVPKKGLNSAESNRHRTHDNLRQHDATSLLRINSLHLCC